MKDSVRREIEEMIQSEVHGLCEAIADQIDERDKALQAVIDKAVMHAIHEYLGFHMRLSVLTKGLS